MRKSGGDGVLVLAFVSDSSYRGKDQSNQSIDDILFQGDGRVSFVTRRTCVIFAVNCLEFIIV